MRGAWVAVVVALAFASGARAEVKKTWAGGFELENRVTVTATADQAWTALGQIGRWWSSQHTYSGDAANMTIEMKPGGCWCEALPGGGVEHGRVILVLPEQKTLRVRAPLGPLQGEGVSAVLTWTITETAGGVEIVQSYSVGGAEPDIVEFAPVVDRVEHEQLEGLRAYLAPPVP